MQGQTQLRVVLHSVLGYRGRDSEIGGAKDA